MAVQAPVRPTAHSLAAAVGLNSNNTRKDCHCSCAVRKTVDLPKMKSLALLILLLGMFSMTSYAHPAPQEEEAFDPGWVVTVFLSMLIIF